MTLARNILICISLFLILCISLIWLLSPWLVRTIAADSLDKLNVVLDEDSRVRLNLFNSSVKIHTLILRHNDQVTYQLDELQLYYSVWKLLKNEVHIKRARLDGMELQVIKQADTLMVGGIDLQRLNSDDSAGIVDADGGDSVDTDNTDLDTTKALSFVAPNIVLENIRINFINEGTRHNLVVDKLAFTQTVYRNQALDSNIHFSAMLDGAAIVLSADVSATPETSALEVVFDINAFNPAMYAYLLPEEISALQAAIDVDLRLSLTREDQAISISEAALRFDLAELEVQEKTYKASVKHLGVSMPEFTAQLNLDGSDMQMQADIDLDLDSLHVGLAESPVVLATLERGVTSDMRVSLHDSAYRIIGNTLSLSNFTLSKVSDDLPTLFAMQTLVLHTMAFTPELVSIDNIHLGAGQANIHIDKNGTLQTLVDTASLAGGQANTMTDTSTTGTSATDTGPAQAASAMIVETEAAPGPRIYLRQLSLSDPLNISIQDKRNSNVFNKTFVLTDIEAGEIDSAEPGSKTTVNIKLGDEGYFKGELAGWITPFTPKMNLDAKVKMREFPLHEVAPYLKDSLGFEVKTGQLDLDFNGSINEDALSSNVTILMRGADFGASQKVDGANVIGQTAIPLNVALGMLKDGDGNIELKVPVNGDINAPSFGMHHIVGMVVKKVAMSQAKKQLMNMFVPYAQVVSIALSAGSYALKVRFEDLQYLPGQTEVGAEQAQFVTQMTALLKDKDDVQVRVCPVAVTGDLVDAANTPITNEQREQLVAIAEQRAQAFKAELVAVGKVESARLLLCSPKIDNKQGAVPRLEFGT